MDLSDKKFMALLKQRVAHSLQEELVSYVCCKMASSDGRDANQMYQALMVMSVRAVLQLPKPLIDECWKMINARAMTMPDDTTLHALRALLSGISAMLEREDNHQKEHNGVTTGQLMGDYRERLMGVREAMMATGMIPQRWSKFLFVGPDIKLPLLKGDVPAETDSPDLEDDEYEEEADDENFAG